MRKIAKKSKEPCKRLEGTLLIQGDEKHRALAYKGGAVRGKQGLKVCILESDQLGFVYLCIHPHYATLGAANLSHP